MFVREVQDESLVVRIERFEVELIMLLLGRLDNSDPESEVARAANHMYTQFKKAGMAEPEDVHVVSVAVNPLISLSK